MQEILRQIPKVDRLIIDNRLSVIPTKLKKQLIIKNIDTLRENIINNKVSIINEDNIINDILNEYQTIKNGSLKHIINATGIAIHTNLGRSPISQNILSNVEKIITRYSNLEYNLTEGKRGDRYHHLNQVGKYLFGDYEILLVNNNASAVFLVLNTFSKSKYTIVSRGELVEIGGGFRIPEVMSNSSALLKEVGTTNKTRISDYDKAIDENTAILMKIHQSNFSIEGFVQEASLQEISTLAKEKNLISYYDLGSGMIEPLDINKNEQTIAQIAKLELDIISFSTDKLIGSIQGGIILAKKHLMPKLKENQLLRMLRADKITIALIEATLKEYLLSNTNNITTYDMLSISQEKLTQKAMILKENIKSINTNIITTDTYTGGGSMPNKTFKSIGIELIVKNAKSYEKYLRENNIISRIEDEKIILDVRTIFDDEIQYIADIINRSKI